MDSSELDHLEKRGLDAPTYLARPGTHRQPRQKKHYHSLVTGEIFGISLYGIVLLACFLVICSVFWLAISLIIGLFI